MSDQSQSKQEPVAELARLRQRIVELEASEGKRRRAEASLRESEDRYRSFVQDFAGIAYQGRIDFSVVFFHGAVDEITGYSEHDFASGEIRWDQLILPDDFARIHDGVEKVRLLPDYATEREYRIMRKDGDTRWVHDVIHNVCDSSGKPAYVQGVIYDVTDRRRGEEALRQSERALREAHDKLEQRVRDRTAELQEANQRLEREIEERKRAEQALRQLLSAHDRERQLIAYEIHDGLAQQLTAASMQIQASHQLQNDSPEKALTAYDAGVEMLGQASAETRRLISGLRPPILDESGIAAAIGHLAHDVTSRGGPDVAFHSSVKPNRLEPLLENAIFRITQESLANAHRHSKSDKASITLVQDKDCMQVEIQDWGIGFDPDRVGESCFGLAGIRERARVLGGQATIESAPGEGTRIVVRLPLRVNEAELP
ncbi:MAG: PAS domain-containing protein [Planctomycetes bacterium]|nr:PAS domain-containing protein [Planctomycetota bacterium]